MPPPAKTTYNTCLQRLRAAIVALLFLNGVQLCSGVPVTAVGVNNASYLEARQRLAAADASLFPGRNLTLTEDERAVNRTLMVLKDKEYAEARTTGFFPPKEHFFRAAPAIEKSSVFKIIKAMPKGAALHLHLTSMVDLWWVVKNATYRDNLYMCYDLFTETLSFNFSLEPPQPPSPPSKHCTWTSVKEARESSGNATLFDRWIHANLSLVVLNPEEAYPTQDVVWSKFSHCFSTLSGLHSYLPFYKDYWWEALQEFNEDNVQYVEMRALFAEIYDLAGHVFGDEWQISTLKEILSNFKDSHPGFVGAKIILSGLRREPVGKVLEKIFKTIDLRARHMDFIAGFDLVGQEDTGNSLLHYLPALLTPSQSSPPVNLPYFFHAGETDWEGTEVDGNLLDALLLNTSRIGHAFAINKHPVVMEMARKKQIAIEVNPISNQVLGLLRDLRTHPAAMLLSHGQPLVVSSDDPAIWGARALSYDWYEMFMGIAGEQADLATLKQLAIDSIRHSAMSETEKHAAMETWRRAWKEFINKFVANKLAFQESWHYMS